MTERPFDPIAIDVGSVLQKTVTSLYAHLVTRPTGRAVRLAIEARLADAGARSLSLIDLSEVTILDYSCADEVVAKLILRYDDRGAHEAYFVFRGVHEPHRDQIQVVLERQGLAVVAETEPGSFELLGAPATDEAAAWRLLEARELIPADEASAFEPEPGSLDRLVARRLAFRSPTSGRYHALSSLVRHLI